MTSRGLVEKDFEQIGVPSSGRDNHLAHPKRVWKAIEGLQQGPGKQQGH